eukprot:2674261-Alexandrium_andersonii.AAC.1
MLGTSPYVRRPSKPGGALLRGLRVERLEGRELRGVDAGVGALEEEPELEGVGSPLGLWRTLPRRSEPA